MDDFLAAIGSNRTIYLDAELFDLSAADNYGGYGETLNFTDAGRISSYAKEAVAWAVENGIISGKGGGILDPQGLATRAQVAQMLKTIWINNLEGAGRSQSAPFLKPLKIKDSTNRRVLFCPRRGHGAKS